MSDRDVLVTSLLEAGFDLDNFAGNRYEFMYPGKLYAEHIRFGYIWYRCHQICENTSRCRKPSGRGWTGNEYGKRDIYDPVEYQFGKTTIGSKTPPLFLFDCYRAFWKYSGKPHLPLNLVTWVNIIDPVKTGMYVDHPQIVMFMPSEDFIREDGRLYPGCSMSVSKTSGFESFHPNASNAMAGNICVGNTANSLFRNPECAGEILKHALQSADPDDGYAERMADRALPCFKGVFDTAYEQIKDQKFSTKRAAMIAMMETILELGVAEDF